MSAPSSPHDRGLRAVARVREVRERDSLLGLQRATAEHAALLAAAQEIDALVAAHAADTSAPLGEWAVRRRALVAVAAAARRAHAEADGAAAVRDLARDHWQRDRSRLGAVETLLERRADARLEEQQRAAARALDDIGGQRWLRARTVSGGETR